MKMINGNNDNKRPHSPSPCRNGSGNGHGEHAPNGPMFQVIVLSMKEDFVLQFQLYSKKIRQCEVKEYILRRRFYVKGVNLISM